MKSCRIWSLHRNPNSPKNPKKCQDFWFMSTIKLTFLSNYRFDFVPWNHSLKPHPRSGGIGWNYFTSSLASHQNPDNPRFAKVSMNIDNSIFKLNFLRNYRPDFFYWSRKRPLYLCSGGFNSKVFYLHLNSDSPKILKSAISFDFGTHVCSWPQFRFLLL